MRPMTGVKGQSTLTILLKTKRMLDLLEHEEGTRTLCLVVGCFFSKTVYECLLGGSTFLPLQECPRSRSRLAVMICLANALTPQIVEGDESLWTKALGWPSSSRQVYGSRLTNILRISPQFLYTSLNWCGE